MAITASYDTLLRQAPDTAETYLRAAKTRIDEVFGKDFAKNNPALVAAFITACSADLNNAVLTVAIQEASDRIAAAMER